MSFEITESATGEGFRVGFGGGGVILLLQEWDVLHGRILDEVGDLLRQHRALLDVGARAAHAVNGRPCENLPHSWFSRSCLGTVECDRRLPLA